MEKAYIISYNLAHSHQDYSRLYETIKSEFHENRHILENSWIVKTEKSASEIAKILTGCLNLDSPSDLFFVSEINPLNAGGMAPVYIWDWIKTLNEPVTFGDVFHPDEYEVVEDGNATGIRRKNLEK